MASGNRLRHPAHHTAGPRAGYGNGLLYLRAICLLSSHLFGPFAVLCIPSPSAVAIGKKGSAKHLDPHRSLERSWRMRSMALCLWALTIMELAAPQTSTELQFPCMRASGRSWGSTPSSNPHVCRASAPGPTARCHGGPLQLRVMGILNSTPAPPNHITCPGDGVPVCHFQDACGPKTH